MESTRPSSSSLGQSVIIGAVIGCSEAKNGACEEAGADGGVGADFSAAAMILKTPPFKLSKILVPKPSLAKTEPERKMTEAEPCALGLKVILKMDPVAPLKPGFGAPPEKRRVPAALE